MVIIFTNPVFGKISKMLNMIEFVIIFRIIYHYIIMTIKQISNKPYNFIFYVLHYLKLKDNI